MTSINEEKENRKQIIEEKIKKFKNRPIKPLIYRITNLSDGKIYIGQTIRGVHIRFKDHCYSSEKYEDTDRISRLHEAMNEEGIENFEIEILEEAGEKDLNEIETNYIQMYNSTNLKFGYNISEHGNSHPIREESRIVRSKSYGREGNGKLCNIFDVKGKSGDIIGYLVRRLQNGILFSRSFSNKKLTLNENLILAKDYLQKIKDKDPSINKGSEPYKISGLPMYILNNSRGKKGYRFTIRKNSKSHTKFFANENLSDQENLQKAIEYRDDFLKKIETGEASFTSRIKTELPSLIKEILDDEDYIIGYSFSKVVNSIAYTKRFNSKDSLEEDLKDAIDYKKKFLEKLEKGESLLEFRTLKSANLPVYIRQVKNKKKEITGYCFDINNPKNHYKAFTDKNISMEKKLKLAIAYKEEYLKNIKELK